MGLLGLYLVGLLPLPFSLGQGLSGWLEARAAPGVAGAFLLGAAFAFAFCPTLFLLFFGLTIPLALASPVGVIYPALFALGTTLPLLGLAALLTAGIGATKDFLAGARRVDAWLRPAAAPCCCWLGCTTPWSTGFCRRQTWKTSPTCWPLWPAPSGWA